VLKNYLKIAFRNLIRHKVYSFINITGLAIGMACSLLIMLYVTDELSYDRFHKNADNIYRVVTDKDIMQSGLVADVLSEEFPEVEKTTRLYVTKITGRNGLISIGEKSFYTDNLIMADPSFFDVFTYHFIKGDPKKSLDDVKSIVITEEAAQKYFGNDDPMGKILMYENSYEFRVTGILTNPPHNSHLKFDFVIPLENYKTIRESPEGLRNWFNNSFVTYTVLKNNIDQDALANRLQSVIEKRVGEKYFPLSFQPLTDIHLYSHYESEIETNNDISSIYIFSTIAVFVLLIACINYMNLSTARSLTRAREVGVRKVVGASRTQLIKQFLGESLLFSLLAFLLAIVIVEILLPAFNDLTDKEIILQSKNFAFLIAIVFGFVIGVGLLAGSYPAFILSTFDPVKTIKGARLGAGSLPAGTRLRNLLLVTQFVVSIGLIASALVISEQMDFIRNKNLGLTKEQVIAIPSHRSKEVVSKIPLLKEEILQSASVLDAAASSHTPGNNLFKRAMRIIGMPQKPVQILWADHNFFKTYQISFAAGRAFSKEIFSDEKNAVILNETAVKELGIASSEDAIGKTVTIDNEIMLSVIGVAKDFHFMSFHKKIPPIVIQIEPRRFYNLSARISTHDIGTTVAYIKEKWHSLFPGRPFEYYFVDADFNRQYDSEQKTSKIFLWFSTLAIIIACFGLLSLSSFTISQKTKEIGIRKVLGASVPEVFFLLSKEFIKWVLIANLIAWPIAWYVMYKWLQNFAYRIEIGWWMFALAGGIALVIALATVSYQAIKAATANPVESLRYE
jgi:putative ABC transport system permease protein